VKPPLVAFSCVAPSVDSAITEANKSDSLVLGLRRMFIASSQVV
jgi:hypothetical protein